MPSIKPKSLWEAKPHTLAKIEIVGRYLYLWSSILGANSANKRLVYIDGFAGPGGVGVRLETIIKKEARGKPARASP
jgi:hypothetical protein